MRRSRVQVLVFGSLAALATAAALRADGRAIVSAVSAAPAATPTFAADIAKIVYANCATCHRPGQAAPFSLLSFDDVKQARTDDRGRDGTPVHAAVARIQGRRLPRVSRRTSPDGRDLPTIERWVDAGMPSGDLAKAPLPPVFSERLVARPSRSGRAIAARDARAGGRSGSLSQHGHPARPARRQVDHRRRFRAERANGRCITRCSSSDRPAAIAAADDDVLPGLGSGLRQGRAGSR